MGQLDQELGYGPSPLPPGEVPVDLLPKYITEQKGGMFGGGALPGSGTTPGTGFNVCTSNVTGPAPAVNVASTKNRAVL